MIAIIGAGGIGSLIGCLLKKSGQEVVLVGRKEHIDSVQTSGLHLTGQINETIKIKGIVSPSELSSEIEFILITTKAYDTEEAIKNCMPLIGKNTFVVSLSNGFGNEDILSKYIDKKKIIGGFTTNAAELVTPGTIKVNGFDLIEIGDYYHKENDEVLRKLKQYFETAGLKTKVRKDIKKEIWRKVLVNSGINALGAIHQVKNKEIEHNKELREELKKIVEEGLSVLKAEGYEYNEDIIEQCYEVCRRSGENFNSMAKDVANGKQTEIDYLNGKIIELGRKHGIKTPFNEEIVKKIKSQSSF